MEEARKIKFLIEATNRMLQYELNGRELASARNEKVSDEDWTLMYDALSDLRRLSLTLSGREREFTESLEDVLSGFEATVDYCFDDERSECKVLLDPPKKGGSPSPKRITLLYALDDASRRLFGRRCTWLFGEVPNEEYSESAFLNDISSCIHKLAEVLEEKYGSFNMEGKCAWLREE